MNTATMRGKACAFMRVSAAAAALTVGLLTGGCGERGQLDNLAGSAGAAVAPEQPAAVYAGMSKRALSRGATFVPDMLGLQPGGTTGELRFNWYSDSASSNGKTFVRVFEGDRLLVEKEGTTGTTSEAPAAADKKYRWHKADVDGLKPNTEYTYWVSNDKENWSEEYSYRSPPSGAFRFAAISDVQYTTGDDITKWQDIAKKIGEEGASLIVNAGDHVEYCTGSSSDTGRGEGGYRKFFSPKELRSIPTAPVMGNHDMCKNFDAHFNLPNVDRVVEKFTKEWTSYYNFSNYYFRYNKVLFVGLNTAPYPVSDTEAKEFVSAYSAIIQAAKAAHSNQYDFLVVIHHKTTTSISAYGHLFESDIRSYVDAGLQRLMTEEKVDLVLTGHDHLYVKSRLMNGDSVSTTGKGTLYLTLKPGGQTRNYNSVNNGPTVPVGFDIKNNNYNGGKDLTQYVGSYPFLQRPYYRENDTKEYYLPWSYLNHSNYDPNYPGYAIIDVAYGRMTIEIHEEDGSIFDTIELKKQ